MALIEVDEAALEGAATDVRAELARLRASVEYLASRTDKDTGRTRIDTMYVLIQDSLFLHHRNLAGFLSGRPPDDRETHRRTDLVAAHYFPAHAWTHPSMPLYNRTGDDMDQRAQRFLNQHLAHLTTERHRNRHAETTDWWHIVEPAAVLDGFDRFLTDLRETEHAERAEWFAVELAAARRQVGY